MCLLDPQRSLFFTSGSLVGHQIWFQIPHDGSNGQCLQDMYRWPIFGPLGPPWEPPKGRFMSKTSRFQAQNSPEYGLLAPKMVIIWPKLTKFDPEYSILVLWINLGHLTTISGAKTPYSRLYGAWKRLVLLMKRPFGGTQGGPKGPKMGQRYISCKHWSFEPSCGVWNQIWCTTRLQEVKKEIFGGPADTSWPPPWPPKPCPDPQNPAPTSQTPPKPLEWPP